MTTKQQYWKYSLILLILLLGSMMINALSSFINGLLGAFTLFVLVRNQMVYLTENKKIKRVLAAVMILLEVITCIIVPLFFLVWLLVGKIQTINMDISSMTTTLQHFEELLKEKTGYNILNLDNLSKITGYITKGVQMLIGQVTSIVITVTVIIFLLYFMLIDYRKIEKYIYELLPFNETNRRDISHEIYSMVRSNAIGIPLIAIIQGAIAYVGYLIFQVPSPFLLAILTCVATIIPIIGTGIIWVPIVVYLALTGSWGNAIGLLIYCSVILINIDNVIRFLLQKKMADTHPLITVFGVFFGLSVFGFWGVIFGPLLMSLFFLLINIFKEEYLDKNN